MPLMAYWSCLDQDHPVTFILALSQALFHSLQILVSPIQIACIGMCVCMRLCHCISIEDVWPSATLLSHNPACMNPSINTQVFFVHNLYVSCTHHWSRWESPDVHDFKEYKMIPDKKQTFGLGTVKQTRMPFMYGCHLITDDYMEKSNRCSADVM